MGAVVMLVGAGHLGGPVLDRLATCRGIRRIIVASRDAARGEARCNLALLTAVAGRGDGGGVSGAAPEIVHRRVDVSDATQVAEALQKVEPDLVLHTASMQTWWLLDRFPPAARSTLKAAGFGAWLPLHLCLALRLMEGVVAAGYGGVVLNAAYPDVINVVLGRLGMAPAAGVGNVDEIAAKVRARASRELNVAAEALQIDLVAHHALQRFAFRPAAPDTDADSDVPPFFLRVTMDGSDVTEASRARAALLAPCPLPEGPGWGVFTAASAVSLVEGCLDRRPRRTHAPGPAGLPGGYPVVAGDRRIEVAEAVGLARAEAIGINERSHRFDGIEKIGDNGAVLFTEQAAAVMRDALGFDCRELEPDAVPERATELAVRFRECASRYGVATFTAMPPTT